MGLWKTGSYSEGRPRVGGIFSMCTLRTDQTTPWGLTAI